LGIDALRLIESNALQRYFGFALLLTATAAKEEANSLFLDRVLKMSSYERKIQIQSNTGVVNSLGFDIRGCGVIWEGCGIWFLGT
jgi:hypothetical protein